MIKRRHKETREDVDAPSHGVKGHHPRLRMEEEEEKKRKRGGRRETGIIMEEIRDQRRWGNENK